MKKILPIIIAVLCLLTTACENKWPRNGYLDGMWQVMNIKHQNKIVYSYNDSVLATASPEALANDSLNAQIHYISFQLDMFELCNRNGVHMYYGYFKKHNNTLRLHQISYHSKNETADDDNILIPDSMLSQTIEPWGLYANDNTFTILQLTEDNMILQNDSTITTIKLRKF